MGSALACCMHTDANEINIYHKQAIRTWIKFLVTTIIANHKTLAIFSVHFHCQISISNFRQCFIRHLTNQKFKKPAFHQPITDDD